MAPKLPRLLVSHLGPIQSADITFGDLTVLVGPQASGKSILFQTLKLALDGKAISNTLALRGIGWGEKEAFTELFYGEGMSSLRNRNTRISWQGRAVSLARDYPVEKAGSQAPVPSSVYYIPAHRVMAIKNGWPRHFSDYSPDDPYVLREFSEHLRGFVELFWQRGDKAIFPPRGDLATGTRKLLQEQLFGEYQLTQEVRGAQKRLVLKRGSEAPLPYIAWSTGQREFGPLLLGCLSVLLRARLEQADKTWVVLEEPEMGLHPRAITAVLFLVLDLLHCGFRVCLSTHSPHVLDLLWALRVFHERKAGPKWVLKLFDVEATSANTRVAASILQKAIKVYYLDRQESKSVDISRLDADSASVHETSWGGLTEWSARAADVVAELVANQR